MTTLKDQRMLTIEEAAAVLHIHKNTAYRMVWQGKLPAVKVFSTWRIPEEALIALMNPSKPAA